LAASVAIEKGGNDERGNHEHFGGDYRPHASVRLILRPAASTEWHPVQKGASEQKLKDGEIAPVDIELYPSSTFFAVGETLQLILASDEIIPSPPYRKSVDCNHGKHVLHFGGKHDSYLLIPKIPPREERLKGGGTKCEPVE
jgi:hypothetical protein